MKMNRIVSHNDWHVDFEEHSWEQEHHRDLVITFAVFFPHSIPVLFVTDLDEAPTASNNAPHHVHFQTRSFLVGCWNSENHT